MQIEKIQLERADPVKLKKSNVVTIGFFDGLHKMHKKILFKTKKLAKKNNCLFSVVTFSQKIRNFLNKTEEHILTRLENYQLITQTFEPDYIFEIQTNMKTITKSKLYFMKYLREKLMVEKIVVGSDFRFGDRASGTILDLIDFFGKKNVIIFKRNHKYASSKLLGALK
ncbi:bifunctional riboflavin kinase/FMN adenylyltransferase [Spiroplasma clarkii]|uniref:FAD synthetase n=1 Tax=Spiroplasma clarkii TaxID=2139 RepID=UPI000B574849|nr:FAD synthetase [Spiroplasma clarkii]ARU91925.1 bifunctional riboflavin kinase/FMN adenylyltransferase [Spiroplasma clarkii]